MNHELKDKLRQAQETGTLMLSSGDVKPEQAQLKPAELPKDVEAQVPVIATRDPLINGSEGKTAGQAVSEAADSTLNPSRHLEEDDGLFTNEKITITMEDKDAFLDALVSGERYCRPFSIYNGRLTGTFRSRSNQESEAMATWMNNGIRDKRYETALDYSMELRSIMLAAQVMELNGAAFDPLAEPLKVTGTKDGMVQPGWLAQALRWRNNNEAIVSAVYDELRRFERRYWTMVTNATNQDFWKPGESTLG